MEAASEPGEPNLLYLLFIIWIRKSAPATMPLAVKPAATTRDGNSATPPPTISPVPVIAAIRRLFLSIIRVQIREELREELRQILRAVSPLAATRVATDQLEVSRNSV